MRIPTCVWILAMASAAALASAQTFPAAGADINQTYAKLCAGCHGEDTKGTQQGPGLSGNPSVRKRSIQSLRTVIRTGIPSAGMPSFDLPADTVNALADFVASLNRSASESNVPGDITAGRQLFFGNGQCSTCHMIRGEGSAVGPDLSAVAMGLTVDQLRDSLLHPDAQITSGYGLVSAALQNGQTLRGFARSRTSFGLVLQDLKGEIHALSMDRVKSVTEEQHSWMPPAKLSDVEVRDLIAFLARLNGVRPGDLPPARSSLIPGGIDFARIQNPKPGDWLTYNGSLSGNRFSNLQQINASNVSRLALNWTASIPLWAQFLPDTPYYRENMRYFGLETVPLVADGIMYVTGPNQAFALDARTGQQIWHYSRPRTAGLVSDSSLGTNRGVALLEDKVFLATDDAHLVALNRVTGRPVWEVVMPDEPQKYGATIAPLVVKDMLVAGVSGGDWGIRGFVAAYKASTGERVWKHWTVPAKGEPGYDSWKGTAVALGGGATWLTGSYDPATNTLYWATGNPWPDSDDRERGGDNLYTNCVLALNPATGTVKWFYQFTPHDVHDWDATEPNVLVDSKFRGQDRKLLLHADRNGFFYVFDRVEGSLLMSQKFTRKLTWASGIGADGRPQLLPESNVTCPDHATNWNGTAFSPATRLYYVMATEKCSVKLLAGGWKTERPKDEPGKKYLRALDIETGKIVWEVPQVGETDGKRVAGLLGTAGHLIFYGDPAGYFVAVDERDGKTLWRVPLNATIKTSPMTYTVDGEQFVAIAVGSNVMSFALPK